MKTIILILAVTALANAVPKPGKLHYRNLFKHPVKEIKSKPTPRIIGGQEAEPHSIPYQVLLEIYSADEGWYCGGTLISQNYVLTAGHCNDEGIEAHITLGAHKSQETEDSQVQAVSTDLTVHKEYDSDLIVNDIGVIKLSKPVQLTDAIQVVPLPSRADASNDYVGTTARISGWGLTDGFGGKLSDVLNYVDADVITNVDCEEAFGDLPESNICTTGDQDTSACSGDSGGPLVADGKQIGVVSFGIIFCLPGYPSAFTRTTSFLDWIEENTDVQIK